MDLPVAVTFKNMDPSAALEERIREKARKLSQFADHITHVDVAVEAPHRHHRKGELYHVRVDVRLPGTEILAAGRNHAHEDPYVAVRDAFAAAQRQLQDYARIRRGDVKSHG